MSNREVVVIQSVGNVTLCVMAYFSCGVGICQTVIAVVKRKKAYKPRTYSVSMKIQRGGPQLTVTYPNWTIYCISVSINRVYLKAFL